MASWDFSGFLYNYFFKTVSKISLKWVKRIILAVLKIFFRSKILHDRDYREEIEITEIFTAPKTASKTCQKPVEDIIFVKTHKTGSSTLQNIIRRFGMNNNLPIAMPVSDGNRFEYPYFFKPTFVKKLPSGRKSRIIANHLRASRELYETFPEAKRITILRDIPSLYEEWDE